MTTTPISVPFADLHAQYLSIKTEIDASIAKVIADSSFIRGPEVDRFEADFARVIGIQHCVTCANGTDAIYITLKSLGVQPGDEVIVPAMSWISSSETVTQAGATVVFCDIDPVTHTIDPEQLSAKLTARTVGIIPVHLYGHPAPMLRIMEFAQSHNLWVIEDCAQAHLASFNDQTVGTFGIAATFSFYPGKNLGAMGDAGAIVTNDRSLAERMAKFARHGGLRKGEHEIEGINSRLDGLQAAILNVKLPHLPDWTLKRQSLAKKYNELLEAANQIKLPIETAGSKHVWHVYAIQYNDRDELANCLRSAGIQTSINYPRALPFLPCYAHMRHRTEDFPNAFELSQRGLALPLFAEMTDTQQKYVCKKLLKFTSA